jgi:acetyl esterase/lipase
MTERGTDNQSEKPRRISDRITGRRAFIAAGVLLVLVLMSSAHVRTGIRSAAFLSEIFPDSPMYPARWFADEPTRTMVQFSYDDRFEGAYLYHPANPGCYGGIVMYIGLGPEHGDPHLDRISRAFARNGISVLIPVSEPMVEYRLDANEHRIAASAFTFLQELPEIDPDRVGMFGISVGGAIVANAAQEPEIREEVAMVHSLGGYYDAATILGQMSAGAFYVDGVWQEWEPSTTTFRATRNSIVPLMPSEDRVTLWQMFGGEFTEIPEEIVTEEGEALARVLVNRDPEAIPNLLAELPDEVTDFLATISPSSGVEDLRTDTLLLHDRFDHVLPYSESVKFAEDLEEAGSVNVQLTVLEQFHHVRPDEEGDRLSLLGDGLRLYRHIFRMHQSMDDRGWFASPLDLLPFRSGPTPCD